MAHSSALGSATLGVGPRTIELLLAKGPGFGDGSHETTELCLQAIYALAPRGRAFRLLDFGSGSGILSIAAAKLGAEVTGIEIDESAIEHAVVNARWNKVSERIRYGRSLSEAQGTYDLVVANILLPVLLDAAQELVARRAPGGALVLSGLVATDVPAASVGYAPWLGEERFEVYERGSWRALVARDKRAKP